jgi:hypothetical protein
MAVISMKPMLPKIIQRKACSRAKGPSRLSKDPRPKRWPNTWRKEESKEIKNFMKVENGGVHCNEYNGCCTKQWIKIPKAT